MNYFFRTACQLVTTVNGDGALEPSGEGYKNRLPSAVTLTCPPVPSNMVTEFKLDSIRRFAFI